MKYKEKLGIIIVILSIILMISGMVLCSQLSINPLLGIGSAFFIIIIGIFLIPNKIMTYDKEEV